MRKQKPASSPILWLLVILSIFGPLAMFIHWLHKRRIKSLLKTRGTYSCYR